jgi:hypothetical protein
MCAFTLLAAVGKHLLPEARQACRDNLAVRVFFIDESMGVVAAWRAAWASALLSAWAKVAV